MTEENHNKFDVASSQLETAIGIFVSGRCRFSAITLAGAADTILSQLVINAGKEPFVDYVRAIEEAASGVTPPRSKMGTHINNALNINALKPDRQYIFSQHQNEPLLKHDPKNGAGWVTSL